MTLKEAFNSGFELGKEYGMFKGWEKFRSEHAFAAALAIVVAFGGVLIALYLITLIVGKVGTIAVGTNMALSNNWVNNITQMDNQATSAVSLSTILPIAVIGVGILGLVVGGLFRTG